MYFTDQLEENMTWLNQALHVDKNFDVVYRVLTISDKKACLYFIDGFTKDDSLLKILQGFSSIKTDDNVVHLFVHELLNFIVQKNSVCCKCETEMLVMQFFLLSSVSY